MQYPHYRKKLFHNLRALADPDYQTGVWVNFEVPYHPYCDEFGEVVHFIFDDMGSDLHCRRYRGIPSLNLDGLTGCMQSSKPSG
jgi:hypothetical protein